MSIALIYHATFQKSLDFKKAVASVGGLVWHGVPGATNQWQPIDSGPGRAYKSKIGEIQGKPKDTYRKLREIQVRNRSRGCHATRIEKRRQNRKAKLKPKLEKTKIETVEHVLACSCSAFRFSCVVRTVHVHSYRTEVQLYVWYRIRTAVYRASPRHAP